jgi:ribosomal protein S3
MRFKYSTTDPSQDELPTQLVPDELSAEEITQAELELEEQSWGQFYLANREHFRAMARQALDDYTAGRTTGITITEAGRLAPA